MTLLLERLRRKAEFPSGNNIERIHVVCVLWKPPANLKQTDPQTLLAGAGSGPEQSERPHLTGAYPNAHHHHIRYIRIWWRAGKHSVSPVSITKFTQY